MMQRQGTARTPTPSGIEASPKRLKCRTLQFTTEQVWAQNPDNQPTYKFIPPPKLSAVSPKH
jgi:hypothetical protein